MTPRSQPYSILQKYPRWPIQNLRLLPEALIHEADQVSAEV